MFGMMLGGFAGIVIMHRTVIAMMMVVSAIEMFDFVSQIEYFS